MIIDIHCHDTTEPAALHIIRDEQLAGLADPARRPAAKTLADMAISDEAIVASVQPQPQPQLKLQRERGSDLTIFSPRATGLPGAVPGIDPETGLHFDDTKRYVDAMAGLDAASRHAVFESNVRRVDPRLDRLLLRRGH